MTLIMPTYDDAEGMLQDQGLEVVVIPYRPSPPPRPPLPPKRRGSSVDNAGTSANRQLDLANSASSDETKSSYDDGSVCESTRSTATPPPPKQQYTPRTQAALAEAMGHKSDTPPPSSTQQPSVKVTATNKPRTQKSKEVASGKHGKKKTAPGRSHSESVPSSTNDNNHARNKNTKSSPPRVRSKSTPAKSPKSSRNKKEKLGFYQMAKLGYQELCNAIIRPPRSNYSLDNLGPEEFVFCNERFVRKDFGVVNERGLLVECSMWKRVGEDDEEEEVTTENKGDIGSDQHHREIVDNRGQITLNVDDWDENKEKGQMYLHVPESFEDESLSSFPTNEECDDGLDELDEMLEKDDSRNDSPQSPTIDAMNLRHKRSETAAHTYYQGSVKTRKRRRDPVVIYLHGNSSGRTEVIPQLGHLLSLGVCVVSFDFTGSGKSEGEFVSLGYYEREDLQTVIHHLRSSGDISSIALWGRSMGAATAIMYGSRDPTISCMILDSSFTSLTCLAEEMVERGKEQGVNVPNFVVSVALRMIKSSVKSQAGFSIRHISPISHVNRCFIPAMFVAGEHDDFIKKKHSEQLHEKYAGDKNLVVVDGDHNSPRPRFLLQSTCLFLQSCMQLPPSLELVVPLGTNLLAPPWICAMTLGRFGLSASMDKARAEAASISASHSASKTEERSWLPVDDTPQCQEQKQQQHNSVASKGSRDDISLNRHDNPPPGLPLNPACGRSRSVPVATSPTNAEFLPPESELPDMSERQKEIQSSLFKMLGQQE